MGLSRRTPVGIFTPGTSATPPTAATLEALLECGVPRRFLDELLAPLSKLDDSFADGLTLGVRDDATVSKPRNIAYDAAEIVSSVAHVNGADGG